VAIAIHHVRVERGSVPVHAGIAVHIQGRGTADLIAFGTIRHMRLMSRSRSGRHLAEALETTGTKSTSFDAISGRVFVVKTRSV
jgi:hypothetical protein